MERGATGFCQGVNIAQAIRAQRIRARGQSLLDDGGLDQAIQHFSDAIGLNPDCDAAFVGRGRALNLKKQYGDAIQDLNEAVRLNPRSADAFNVRGFAYNGKKDHDRAIQDLDEAIRLRARSDQVEATYPAAVR